MVVFRVIIVHQFRIEGIEYHVPQEISWVTRPPFSTLDITLIDFGLWVDARNSYVSYVCRSHAIMEYLACTRAGVADHW